MSLAEYREEVMAWNQAKGDDKSLSDRELEGLVNWMDKVEAGTG